MFGWLRRRLRDAPSKCLNCGGYDFEKWKKMDRFPRWDCEDCEWTHAATFGGYWRADPPEDVDERPIIIR